MSEQIPKSPEENAYTVCMELFEKEGKAEEVGINLIQDICKARFGVGGGNEGVKRGRARAIIEFNKIKQEEILKIKEATVDNGLKVDREEGAKPQNGLEAMGHDNLAKAITVVNTAISAKDQVIAQLKDERVLSDRRAGRLLLGAYILGILGMGAAFIAGTWKATIDYQSKEMVRLNAELAGKTAVKSSVAEVPENPVRIPEVSMPQSATTSTLDQKGAEEMPVSQPP